MQPYARRWHLRLGIACMALLVAACGSHGTGTATATKTLAPTPTPAPHLALFVADQAQSGTDASAADMSVTATCPPGATVVSGGYHLQPGNDQQLVYIRSNYPSAADAWTVTESNPQSGGFVGLNAFAYCLTASTVNLTVTMTSTTAQPNGMGAAACPAGTALVGGGFKQATLIGSGWVNASYPANNGWQVAGPAPQNGASPLTIYALCASQPVTAQSIATATTAIANNAGGYAEAKCPKNAYAIGGGYTKTGGALYIGTDDWASSRDFTQWGVGGENLYVPPVVGGGGPTPTPPASMQVTAYAICVTFP